MRNGRTLGWESLAAQGTPGTLPVTFPNVSNVAAGITTRFVSLIPQNVTRGAVTIVRIRGWMNTIFDVDDIGGAGGVAFAFCPYNIQLVPVQDGVISLDSVLDPRNAADLESNRILWRRTDFPLLITTGGLLESQRKLNQLESPVVDVKTQRRFDRATWALIACVSFPTVEEINVLTSIDLRALFKTTDGL